MAATLSLAACTAQKSESLSAKDSAAATAPLTAPAPTVVAPAAVPTVGVTGNESGKAHKTPAAGRERDSAVQAVFEIGPDGKMRRVKR